MRLFKRKEKALCFHEWRIADVGVWMQDFCDDEDYYDLGCEKCGEMRRVGSYEYSRMKEAGVVK